MTNNKIINLKYPQNNSDACNKSYVDNNIKNVNTKITNVVMYLIILKQKIESKNMLINHILLVVLI